MRIAFRTDASLQIGTGHVMRCLTLADALSERGAQCSFICRPHTGHLLNLIAQRGHQTLPLRAVQEGASPNIKSTAHVDWLGTDWATDAADTLLALSDSLGGETLDWLAVDHYALERRWEQALRPSTRRIISIDDLADRPHDCDLLLDQNLGRTNQDYSGLLNPNTAALIGPHYALLRPEFAALRPKSLARRAQNPQLKNLLITLGGVDKDNATGQALDALKECRLPSDLRITVVMGPHAPWLAQVQAQVAHIPWQTQVLVAVSNMAQLMSDIDLAIGAAGGTAWERCCLGLPTLMLVLAENQQAGAKALQSAGAAIALKEYWQIPVVLGELLSAKGANSRLTKMSSAAAAVTDGTGCVRASDQMMDSIRD